MSTIAIQLLVQVILILINAFFAATEISVISLNANKLRMLEESGMSAFGIRAIRGFSREVNRLPVRKVSGTRL